MIEMPGNDRSERANGALALPQLELDRRERADAARNREAILCAAQRLVSERGVDGVTMDPNRLREPSRLSASGIGSAGENLAGFLRDLRTRRPEAFDHVEERVRDAYPKLEEVEIQGELLAAAEAGAPGDRLAHRVYGAHRAHIRALLLEAAPGCDADYLADVLLGALTAELVLHQRRSLEMTAERLKGGWISLVDGVLSSARALAGR